MRDIHKYLYAVFAACFIGIGSGFVTLFPYVLDYESKAIQAGAKLEQSTKLDYDEIVNCREFPDIYAECTHAKYLLKTNAETAKILKNFAYSLTIVGVICLVLGVYLHSRNQGSKNAQ